MHKHESVIQKSSKLLKFAREKIESASAEGLRGEAEGVLVVVLFWYKCERERKRDCVFWKHSKLRSTEIHGAKIESASSSGGCIVCYSDPSMCKHESVSQKHLKLVKFAGAKIESASAKLGLRAGVESPTEGLGD